LRGCSEKKKKEDIGDQGRARKSQGEAKGIQVRGVLIVCFIVISYEDVFWIMFEL